MMAEGLSRLLRIEGWMMRATTKHIPLYGWTSISFEVPVTLKSARHHAYEEGGDARLVAGGFCVSSRPNRRITKRSSRCDSEGLQGAARIIS